MRTDGKGFIDIMKTVFPKELGDKKFSVTNPTGKTYEALKKELPKNGNGIMLLVYTQKDFWGKRDTQPTDLHGIGFNGATFNEPYLGRVGTFNQIRGNPAAKLDDYIPDLSYIYTWE